MLFYVELTPRSQIFSGCSNFFPSNFHSVGISSNDMFFHANPSFGIFGGLESVRQSCVARGFFNGGYPHTPSFKTTLLNRCFFTFPGLSLVASVVEGVKFFFELVSFDIGVFHSHVPPGQGFLPSKGFFFTVTILWAFFRVTLTSCLVFGSVLDLSVTLNLIFPMRWAFRQSFFIAITLVFRVSVLQALVLHPEDSFFAVSL